MPFEIKVRQVMLPFDQLMVLNSEQKKDTSDSLRLVILLEHLATDTITAVPPQTATSIQWPPYRG